MKKVVWIAAMLVVTGAVALGWAYSGQYNVAADAPHWDVTTRVLATVRERSIRARAAVSCYAGIPLFLPAPFGAPRP